jgi:hypothetical protein
MLAAHLNANGVTAINTDCATVPAAYQRFWPPDISVHPAIEILSLPMFARYP